jgi:hypothetical protein
VAWLAGVLALAGCGQTSEPEGTAQGGAAGASGAAATGGAAHGGDSGSGGGMVSGAPAIPVEPAEPPPDCRRDVSLTAVTLSEPPPFDLIIVADHSGSLAWSRDELSSGLRTLLDDVRGRSVRVFLLTPTQYGASSALAQMPLSGESLVLWQDPSTGQAYENAVTNFVRTCTDLDGAPIDCPDIKGTTPHKIRGEWVFEMPPPIAVLTPELDASAFAAEQARVTDAILGLGGSGSSLEQPLCTLGRYVSQDELLLPDHAVFLIVSDEDDTSLPRECLVGYDAELGEVGQRFGPCSGECDAYRYAIRGTARFEQLAMRCQAFDDLGNPVPNTESMSSLSDGSLTGCESIGPGPCSEEEKAKAAPFCPPGLGFVDCTRECPEVELDCSVDRPNADTDLCTQSFQQNGSSGIDRLPVQSLSGSMSPRPLAVGTETADLARYVRTTATAKFGAANYLTEAIVLDPQFSCEVNAGQSHATNLVDFVSDRKYVFPLCESYAPALNGVWGFAQSLVTTEYPLMLEFDEHVSAVVIVAKDGSERALDSTQYSHDEASGVLTIDRQALRATDATLRVEVTSECRKTIE